MSTAKPTTPRSRAKPAAQPAPDAEAAQANRETIAEALTAPGGNLADLLAEGAPEVTHLHVRALRDGRRRAGRAWPAAGVEVRVEDFTDDQVAQLFADPQLSVTAISAPEAE